MFTEIQNSCSMFTIVLRNIWRTGLVGVPQMWNLRYPLNLFHVGGWHAIYIPVTVCWCGCHWYIGYVYHQPPPHAVLRSCPARSRSGFPSSSSSVSQSSGQCGAAWAGLSPSETHMHESIVTWNVICRDVIGYSPDILTWQLFDQMFSQCLGQCKWDCWSIHPSIIQSKQTALERREIIK